MEDDSDDPVSQYIIVAQAIKHRAQQSLPEQSDPLLNVEQCQKNYHYIVQTIAGFSAQISSKCCTAFPHVFSKQDMMAVLHLLAGLCEFTDIHHQYQCNSTSVNLSSAWKANFEALSEEIQLNTSSISAWINNMKKSVQGLNLAKVPSDAIDGAVCSNVIDKLGSFTDASDVVDARWLSRSDSLRTRSDLRVYAWNELFDILQSYLSKDASKEECTTGGAPTSGPRKRKVVQPDGAAAFFTLAQMQQMYAYFMGHNTGGSSPGLGTPQGGGCRGSTPNHCGTSGGPNLKCPNPKCKIHHPGGLDKCPYYEETKTIIA
eukprot:3925465-Rhodomonas_salina.1